MKKHGGRCETNWQRAGGSLWTADLQGVTEGGWEFRAASLGVRNAAVRLYHMRADSLFPEAKRKDVFIGPQDGSRGRWEHGSNDSSDRCSDRETT